MRQQTLDPRIKAHATFARFYPGPNQTMLAMLQTLKPGTLCVLLGDSGCGKTHLLHALAHQNQPQACFYAPMKRILHHQPTILAEVEQHHAVILLDDLDSIALEPAWQQACVHMINQAQFYKKTVVLSAHNAPQVFKSMLPDLQSRLTSGLVFHIKPLPDDTLAQLLLQMTEEKGLTISDAHFRYIMHHGPRQVGPLQQLLTSLDQQSLMQKKPITLPLIKKALKTLQANPTY
jgi:DnaA-homolog protein